MVGRRCIEIEKDAAIGSRHNLYRLISNSALHMPSVGKVIKESEGTLIHSRKGRLAR